ncbi:MAG: VOC family protein [Treponema sp.]|jgi:methylmalonyl-CoA/ethylmalonyl-CoA epimerase|nr:VOC family protein [Treponema sp.]
MLSDFQFHHVGIATDSIKDTARYYLDADYAISDTVYDPVQGVYIAFLEKDGMPRMELIEPFSPPPPPPINFSPVRRIIEKLGVSPYHICYEVNNMENAMNELRKQKYLLLTRPVKAIAMNNRKICFLYNKEVGLIELVECAI